uniref:Uncharacterized protein n=1 Tax=Mola mola TaxID=94237 RepID=A0A3Q3X3E1_MOLML
PPRTTTSLYNINIVLAPLTRVGFLPVRCSKSKLTSERCRGLWILFRLLLSSRTRPVGARPTPALWPSRRKRKGMKRGTKGRCPELFVL